MIVIMHFPSILFPCFTPVFFLREKTEKTQSACDRSWSIFIVTSKNGISYETKDDEQSISACSCDVNQFCCQASSQAAKEFEKRVVWFSWPILRVFFNKLTLKNKVHYIIYYLSYYFANFNSNAASKITLLA